MDGCVGRLARRWILAGVLGGVIPVASSASAEARDWIGLPYRLSDPGTFVRNEPFMTTDPQGRVHLFWAEDSAQMCCSGPDQSSLLRYAVFDGGVWKGPVELVRLLGTRVDGASVSVDGAGFLHVAWIQRGQGGPIHYMTAPITNALQPGLWSPPVRLELTQPQATQIRLRVDAAGGMHLVFSRTSGASQGFFYSRSANAGGTWSAPAHLASPLPDGFRPGVFQLEVDERGALHAVWLYEAIWEFAPGQERLVGRSLRYSRSLDGGIQWSAPAVLDEFDPAVDDVLTHSVGSPHGIAFAGDGVHVVWTGGPLGGPVGVGRKHRVSPDRGATWGELRTDIFGVWGEQNGDGLAADSSGGIHWAGLARKPLGPGQPLWEGLWSARWDGNGWSEPARVETLISPLVDTPRLAAAGDDLLAAFRSRETIQGQQIRNLHATHTAPPSLHFPHFGDGAGLSMLFAVNNPSETTAIGRLTVFGQDGEPLALPFQGIGTATEVELAIAPKATAVLTTLGTSAPLATGYVRIETDRPDVGGVAIFRYASGPEASVMPGTPGRRFALFVERSDTLQTGIALARLTPRQPLSLRLYELDGSLRESLEYDMAGPREAWFVDEVLDVPAGFQGLLLVESEALLTAVGLRFGEGILSTIPVAELDAPLSEDPFYFPHYGDGGGLSMRFALSNFDSAATAGGELRVQAPDGSPQALPFHEAPDDRVALSLTPHSSRVLATDGSSNPLKSGFVKVTAGGAAIGGVAIFKYASGPEASVLPSYPGRKFSLFVERSATLDTGIAVAREEREEVRLILYDVEGTWVAEGILEFAEDGYHRAAFLGEILPGVPGDFRGMLLIESEGDFSTVGLRFGGGVLATIPVTPVPR